DRAAVGEHVAGGTADGRVLDLDVSGGARPKQLAARIDAARAEAPTGEAGTVRLVRLVGPDLDGDPVGTTGQHAAASRARDLVAPNPTPRRTLRARLGLPTAPFRPDPARRGDRARTSREESA